MSDEEKTEVPEPVAGAQQEELGGDLDAEFSALMAEATDPAAEAQAQQQAEQVAMVNDAREEFKTLFTAVLSPLFPVVAPAWQVSNPEVEALAESYAAVAAEYCPEGVGEIGPWAGAAITTLAIFGPRVRMPRHLPKPQETQQQPQQIDSEGGRGAEA